MSLNFAMKDLFYYSEQSKLYLRNCIVIIGFAIIFLNFTQSIGVLSLSAQSDLFTVTIIELFSQYNNFLVLLTYCLAIVIVLLGNHAIIIQRKKDIAIMQALGTVPRHVYSLYMSEILLLSIFCFFIAWGIGFGLFLIVYLIFSPFLSYLIWAPDFYFSLLMGILIVIMTYIINGYEIRSIGRKTFIQNKTGKMDEIVHGKFSLRTENILAKLSLSLKMAFHELIRKKSQFRHLVITVTIASSIILTSFTGLSVTSSTAQGYVQKAQGKAICVIGHEDVLPYFAQGYERFANKSVAPFSEVELYASEYNLSVYQQTIHQFLSNYTEVSTESRILLIENITEMPGYIAEKIPDSEFYSGNFTKIGSNRSQILPLQGVQFGSSVQNWEVIKDNSTKFNGIAVGDTLALTMFENAFLQSFSLYNDQKSFIADFHISAALLDSFNNGNTAYVNLTYLQNKMELGNYTNLFLIDYNPLIEKGAADAFLLALKTFVQIYLGDSFEVLVLTDKFAQNVQSLSVIWITTLQLVCFIGLVIIFSLYQFQKENIEDDQKDLFIFKSLGTDSSILHRMWMYEQWLTIIVGSVIGFAINLIIILFFLMDRSILPDIIVPFGYLGLFIGIFFICAYISTKILTKKYFNSELLQYMRT